ncbi:MAG: hypothetical protein KBS75_08315 [Bacteroidales bacterium]|nr:hypothetical protein [Candidatus Equimonas faecalis]
MPKKTRRTRIAESDATLAFTLLLLLLAWGAGRWTDPAAWAGMGGVVLTTYWILETNNRCHLLRLRSRMMSSSFLLMCAALPLFIGDLRALGIGLALAAFNHRVLVAYGDDGAVGRMFTAGLALGAGICLYPPMVLMVPLLWIGSHRNLRVLSLRSWTASLLGLLTPAAYVLPWMVWTGRSVGEALGQYLHLPLYAWPHWTLVASAALMVLTALWAIAHFRRTSYKDNTRTRMSLSFTVEEFYAALLLTAFWPDHPAEGLMLMAVAAAPVAGHWWALAEHRFQGFCCWLLLWLWLALTAVNALFMPR